MGLHLWAAARCSPPPQRPGGAGLRRHGNARGKNLPGRAKLRLRLAPALHPGGDQGTVYLQPAGHRAGGPVRRGNPIRRDGPVPFLPLHRRRGDQPRGLVRGRQEHGRQAPPRGRVRLPGGGLLEPHAALLPDLAGAGFTLRH